MNHPLVWALRRLVVAPAVIGLTVLIWVSLPLWLLVAAALSPVLPGRWRALRLLWVVVLYLTFETLMLAVLLGLWLASGFGWKIRSPYFAGIHYDLVQGTLIVFFREARRVLALRIRTDGPHPPRVPEGPVLVMCRHAGPGDSFILMYALLHWYAREPRVVLKNTLAWDPAIDVVLGRIPARFISPNPEAGEDLESQIAALATGLDHNDAFVIFPEGGNFTPARRDKAIVRLRKLGLERMAVRAEEMTHVLAPRPGGVLAALEAAPEADVLMVAHTGLDHLVTVSDLWRELPMDKQITMRWWQVPRAEIPADREARIDWLYGWWERVDEWIEVNRVVERGGVPSSRPDRRTDRPDDSRRAVREADSWAQEPSSHTARRAMERGTTSSSGTSSMSMTSAGSSGEVAPWGSSTESLIASPGAPPPMSSVAGGSAVTTSSAVTSSIGSVSGSPDVVAGVTGAAAAAGEAAEAGLGGAGGV